MVVLGKVNKSDQSSLLLFVKGPLIILHCFRNTHSEDIFDNRSLLNFVEKEEEGWKERKEKKGNESCI